LRVTGYICVMKSFLTPLGALKTTAAVLFAVLMAAVMHAQRRPEPPAEHTPDSRVEISRLDYRNISVERSAQCQFFFDESEGAEFRVLSFGREQLRVAFDSERYWIWSRQYDPKKYFYCGVKELSDSSIKSIFRPSFSRWMVNDERTKEDEVVFRDGEYKVTIKLSSGSVVSQTYELGGATESSVVIHTFQRVEGRELPLLATLKMPEDGLSLEINMGAARTRDCTPPNLHPPKGTSGSPIRSAL